MELGLVRTNPTCINLEKKRRTYRCLLPNLHLAAIRRLRIVKHFIKNLEVVMNSRHKGRTFCQVKKIKAFIFPRFMRRPGPQKCNGARLAFSSKPKQIHFHNTPLLSLIRPPARILREPILWTIKYIILTFLLILLSEISGRKDIRFTSSPTQRLGHVSTERAPRTLSTTPVHISDPIQPSIIPFIR